MPKEPTEDVGCHRRDLVERQDFDLKSASNVFSNLIGLRGQGKKADFSLDY